MPGFWPIPKWHHSQVKEAMVCIQFFSTRSRTVCMRAPRWQQHRLFSSRYQSARDVPPWYINICIYVCIYICIYIYMYIYVYMYIYIYTHRQYNAIQNNTIQYIFWQKPVEDDYIIYIYTHKGFMSVSMYLYVVSALILNMGVLGAVTRLYTYIYIYIYTIMFNHVHWY